MFSIENHRKSNQTLNEQVLLREPCKGYELGGGGVDRPGPLIPVVIVLTKLVGVSNQPQNQGIQVATIVGDVNHAS